jgi:hypothetical protein
MHIGGIRCAEEDGIRALDIRDDVVRERPSEVQLVKGDAGLGVRMGHEVSNGHIFRAVPGH